VYVDVIWRRQPYRTIGLTVAGQDTNSDDVDLVLSPRTPAPVGHAINIAESVGAVSKSPSLTASRKYALAD